MVSITKEDIEIDETLKKKIKNTLIFLGIKAKVQKGSIRSISNTNIAYVEPHKLEIKHINFRKTFIEEYAKLFNNGAINRFQDVSINGESLQMEVCAPMTRKEIETHVKRLQVNYSIDYQEIKKEKYNDHQFCLKYTRENRFNEPLKMISIVNKKGLNKVESYGIIEVPVSPITFLCAERIEVQEK